MATYDNDAINPDTGLTYCQTWLMNNLRTKKQNSTRDEINRIKMLLPIAEWDKLDKAIKTLEFWNSAEQVLDWYKVKNHL